MTVFGKPAPFLALSVTASTLLEMFGDTQAIRWLHYSCKPLIMGCLLLYVWQQFRALSDPKPIRWLLTGMLFALAGDVFLMIREVDLFAPGLGAFLVMQLCYSTAFRQSMRTGRQPITGCSVGAKAFPFGVYSGAFLLLLKPAFDQNSALTSLWWPVVVYSLCLSTMGLMATLRQGVPGYGSVVAGALLFILSDSLIAVDKFLQPVPGATWLIMTTYAMAQYLIVAGMVRPYGPGVQQS